MTIKFNVDTNKYPQINLLDLKQGDEIPVLSESALQLLNKTERPALIKLPYQIRKLNQLMEFTPPNKLILAEAALAVAAIAVAILFPAVWGAASALALAFLAACVGHEAFERGIQARNIANECDPDQKVNLMWLPLTAVLGPFILKKGLSINEEKSVERAQQLIKQISLTYTQARKSIEKYDLPTENLSPEEEEEIKRAKEFYTPRDLNKIVQL